mmetsp:Transcript_40948/g.80360  ORF Transcript_40948/g.80360 Transcript_40948/m.80360 type:complete len:205 (-) Transcript_40948:727-1341(-)
MQDFFLGRLANCNDAVHLYEVRVEVVAVNVLPAPTNQAIALFLLEPCNPLFALEVAEHLLLRGPGGVYVALVLPLHQPLARSMVFRCVAAAALPATFSLPPAQQQVDYVGRTLFFLFFLFLQLVTFLLLAVHLFLLFAPIIVVIAPLSVVALRSSSSTRRPGCYSSSWPLLVLLGQLLQILLARLPFPITSILTATTAVVGILS